MSACEISITVNDLTDVEYSFAESYSVNQDTSVSSQKLDHESAICRMEDCEPNDIQHGDSNLTLSSDAGHLPKQSDEKAISIYHPFLPGLWLLNSNFEYIL